MQFTTAIADSKTQPKEVTLCVKHNMQNVWKIPTGCSFIGGRITELSVCPPLL
jgi:hypothetical protein